MKRGRRRNVDKNEGNGPSLAPRPRGRPPKKDGEAAKRRKLMEDSEMESKRAFTPTGRGITAFDVLPENIQTFQEHQRHRERERITRTSSTLHIPAGELGNASLYKLYWGGAEDSTVVNDSRRRYTRKQKKEKEKIKLQQQQHILFEVNPDQLVSQPLVDPVDVSMENRTRIVEAHVLNWIQLTRNPVEFDSQSSMAINLYYPSAHPTLLDHILVTFILRRPELGPILLPKLFERLLYLRPHDLSLTEQPILHAFYAAFAVLRTNSHTLGDKARYTDACLSILRILLEANDLLLDEQLNFSYWIAGCLVDASDEFLHGVLRRLLEYYPESDEIASKLRCVQLKNPSEQLISLFKEEQYSTISTDVGRLGREIVFVTLDRVFAENPSLETQTKWFDKIKFALSSLFSCRKPVAQELMMALMEKYGQQNSKSIIQCAHWLYKNSVSGYAHHFVPFYELFDQDAEFFWHTVLVHAMGNPGTSDFGKNIQESPLISVGAIAKNIALIFEIASDSFLSKWRQIWLVDSIQLPPCYVVAMTEVYMGNGNTSGFDIDFIVHGLQHSVGAMDQVVQKLFDSSMADNHAKVVSILNCLFTRQSVPIGLGRSLLTHMVLRDESINGFSEFPARTEDDSSEIPLSDVIWNVQHDDLNCKVLRTMKYAAHELEGDAVFNLLLLLLRSSNTTTLQAVLELLGPIVTQIKTRHVVEALFMLFAHSSLDVREAAVSLLYQLKSTDILPTLLAHCVETGSRPTANVIGEIIANDPDLCQNVFEFCRRHVSSTCRPNANVLVLMQTVCEKMTSTPDLESVQCAMVGLDHPTMEQLQLLSVLFSRADSQRKWVQVYRSLLAKSCDKSSAQHSIQCFLVRDED